MFIDNLPHLLSITKSPSCKLRSRASGACVCGATRNFNLHLCCYAFFVLLSQVCEFDAHCWLLLQNNRPVSMHTCQLRSMLVSVFEQKKRRSRDLRDDLASTFLFLFSTHRLWEQFYCWCRCRRRRRVIMHYYLMCVFCKNEITSGRRRDGTHGPSDSSSLASTIIFLPSALMPKFLCAERIVLGCDTKDWVHSLRYTKEFSDKCKLTRNSTALRNNQLWDTLYSWIFWIKSGAGV